MSKPVTVRKLKLEDMPRFLEWGHHTDVRYQHYDFPKYTPDEQKLWYKSKTKFLRRLIYISEDCEGNLLGYMTIKHINWFTSKAEMGIVFNPEIISKGYGTASIRKLFDIYFCELRMKTLYLKVADFNVRAQRCYTKAGFKLKQERLEAFEDQDRNFDLLLKTDDFFMRKGVLITKFHYMEITKEEYEALT